MRGGNLGEFYFFHQWSSRSILAEFYAVLLADLLPTSNDSQCQDAKTTGVGRGLGCAYDRRQYLVERGSTCRMDRCYG